MESLEGQRRETPRIAPEKVMLQAFLDYHRATFLQKIGGLNEQELRSELTPSKMSLLGLVKHLAYGERYWFQYVFEGLEVTIPWYESGQGADWIIGPDENLASVLDFFHSEVARSREIIARASLDDNARRPPGIEHSLRWIMLHRLEELARHNGHADIMRETIDGTVGE